MGAYPAAALVRGGAQLHHQRGRPLESGPCWTARGEVSLVDPACVPPAGPTRGGSALGSAPWASQRARESEICREGQLRLEEGEGHSPNGTFGLFQNRKMSHID